MKFCHLEKDEKSYHLVLLYMEHFLQNQEHCLKLDNRIQWDEIQNHLRINGRDSDDYHEIQRWIEEHSASYRCYLNTLKLAAFSLIAAGIDPGTMTWESYCSAGDRLNGLKEYCLDSIY